jgi:hypothetical protein
LLLVFIRRVSLSVGLFHQAIAMSGSSFLDAFFEKIRLPFARRQAALLNCPTYTSQEIKDCLMKKGAQEIASSLNRLAVSMFSKYTPLCMLTDLRPGCLRLHSK